MDDFEALISSLGEHAVGYIGKDHLRQLAVYGDPSGMSARVEICLDVNSWEEQTRAIDKMIEVRTIFFEELSLDYHFVDEDSCTTDAAQRSSYSYA